MKDKFFRITIESQILKDMFGNIDRTCSEKDTTNNDSMLEQYITEITEFFRIEYPMETFYWGDPFGELDMIFVSPSQERVIEIYNLLLSAAHTTTQVKLSDTTLGVEQPVIFSSKGKYELVHIF